MYLNIKCQTVNNNHVFLCIDRLRLLTLSQTTLQEMVSSKHPSLAS